MAQAKLNSHDKTDSTLKDKEKETDEKEGNISVNYFSKHVIHYTSIRFHQSFLLLHMYKLPLTVINAKPDMFESFHWVSSEFGWKLLKKS